jgi:hypothetical protein
MNTAKIGYSSRIVNPAPKKNKVKKGQSEVQNSSADEKKRS